MKKFTVLLISIFASLSLCAQTKFKGGFYSESFKMQLVINLEESDIPVPGLELENCYGYLKGNINGMWTILKVKELTDDKAIVRCVSERGSDAQDLELVMTEEGLTFKQVNDVCIKGVESGKYAKLPKLVVFKKQ